MTTSTPRTIRAPRGTTLSCKGWLQEAAYRMIQNNLDPEVAYDPEHLIVYGGRYGALAGIALDYVFIFTPMAAYILWSASRGGGPLLFGLL